MKPLTISLIIPAFNEEKYLGGCLDHVIKNAPGVFSEIIVIDNASTDRTSKIAANYPGVRVVHEPTKGLTYARQRGFTESTGDILVYIDADTHITNTWAQVLTSEFTHHQDMVCLSGPYYFYDYPNWRQWHLHATCMLGYYVFGYFVLGGNFAIRRTTLEKMNGFDTTIKFYGEDTNIARRAHVFGKVLFLKKFFIYTSARRFKGQGFFTTSWVYLINFLSEIFMRKPATKDYNDIR